MSPYSPLPYQIQPFSIKAVGFNSFTDPFMSGRSCEFVKTEIDSIRSSSDLYSYLDGKYQDTVEKLAQAIYRDPHVFKAKDAVKYIDSLYAKYIDK